MHEKMVFTDRYLALGIPYPDPETVCKGRCEGTGVYPVKADRDGQGAGDDEAAWLALHRRECSLLGKLRRFAQYILTNPRWAFRSWRCDGWHFVTCPDCSGTGKRVGERKDA